MDAASAAPPQPAPVDAVNFVRAESVTYFDSLVGSAGGLGRWHHIRESAANGAPGPSGLDASCRLVVARTRSATSAGKSAGCLVARARSHPCTSSSTIRTCTRTAPGPLPNGAV